MRYVIVRSKAEDPDYTAGKANSKKTSKDKDKKDEKKDEKEKRSEFAIIYDDEMPVQIDWATLGLTVLREGYLSIFKKDVRDQKGHNITMIKFKCQGPQAIKEKDVEIIRPLIAEDL